MLFKLIYETWPSSGNVERCDLMQSISCYSKKAMIRLTSSLLDLGAGGGGGAGAALRSALNPQPAGHRACSGALITYILIEVGSYTLRYPNSHPSDAQHENGQALAAKRVGIGAIKAPMYAAASYCTSTSGDTTN
ncbi:hypothetical protein EVAR_32967_1 [Eumeta japonica]|uniref:Uncharacterized protein n=1 Tax=Eumeta variegata TaxID=151549 RepID=A0A4C1X0A5_EUMVA|nr:hypothetical protein EVAR_32967_1 [Eumeta japonica]